MMYYALPVLAFLIAVVIHPFNTYPDLAIYGIGGAVGLVSLWVTALVRPRAIAKSHVRATFTGIGLLTGVATILFATDEIFIPDLAASRRALGHLSAGQVVFVVLGILTPCLLALCYGIVLISALSCGGGSNGS
jgi:hypothetical protein